MFQEMDVYEKSLAYHAAAPPGMFSIEPTKPMSTQRDLFLANFPGVAQPCLEIEKGKFPIDCLGETWLMIVKLHQHLSTH